MTVPDTLPDTLPAEASTATGPTVRGVLRRNRALLLGGTGLVVLLGLVAVLTGSGRTGNVDPDAYDPGGARALATLLRDQGVQVVRTTDVPATAAATTEATTVFVPLPEVLSSEELTALADLPGRLVLVGAGGGGARPAAVGDRPGRGHHPHTGLRPRSRDARRLRRSRRPRPHRAARLAGLLRPG